MHTKTILNYIRRSEFLRLIYPILLLAVILFLTFQMPFQDYANRLHLTKEDTLTRKSAATAAFASVSSGKLYYSGSDLLSNGQLKGHFYYELRNGTCYFYLLRASAGKPADAVLNDYTTTGQITALGSELDALAASMAELTSWDADSMKGLIFPYYIDETSLFTWKQLLFGSVLLAAFLFALISLLLMLLLICFPKLSPAYQRLRHYGIPCEILETAEYQLRHECLLRTKDMALTTDYFMEFSEDTSAIIPLTSILWTYDHAVLRHTLKGKQLSYTIHIVTVQGNEYALKRKSAEDVNQIYNELTSRFPNYFYGYSSEHLELVRHLLREQKAERVAEKRTRISKKKNLQV